MMVLGASNLTYAEATLTQRGPARARVSERVYGVSRVIVRSSPPRAVSGGSNGRMVAGSFHPSAKPPLGSPAIMRT